MTNIFNLHAENCLSISNDLIGNSNRERVVRPLFTLCYNLLFQSQSKVVSFFISKLLKKNAYSNMDIYVGIPLLKIKNWLM